MINSHPSGNVFCQQNFRVSVMTEVSETDECLLPKLSCIHSLQYILIVKNSLFLDFLKMADIIIIITKETQVYVKTVLYIYIQ